MIKQHSWWMITSNLHWNGADCWCFGVTLLSVQWAHSISNVRVYVCLFCVLTTCIPMCATTYLCAYYGVCYLTTYMKKKAHSYMQDFSAFSRSRCCTLSKVWPMLPIGISNFRHQNAIHVFLFELKRDEAEVIKYVFIYSGSIPFTERFDDDFHEH